MQRKFPHLCSPLTVGNVTFRNRMCSAPMSGAEITAAYCGGAPAGAVFLFSARFEASPLPPSAVFLSHSTILILGCQILLAP